MEFESANEINKKNIINCFDYSEIMKMRTLLESASTNIRGQMAQRQDKDKQWLKIVQQKLHNFKELTNLCRDQIIIINNQKKDKLRFQQIFIEIAQQKIPKEQFKEFMKLARELSEQDRLDKKFNAISYIENDEY